MVVHQDIKSGPEVVVTSATKPADDTNNEFPLLFEQFRLQPRLSPGRLAQLFEKLQDLVTGSDAVSYLKISTLKTNGSNLRLRAVTIIRCLSVFFSGTNDVFATSCAVLDQFMSLVKVQEKYLSCVAAACFFISMKAHMEEEEIPVASDLARLHGHKWTSSDLCRMEVLILGKLQWNIPKITYLTFLRLFDEMFGQIEDNTSLTLDGLIHLAEHTMKVEESKVFKPSTLALCVFSQLLEQCHAITTKFRLFLLRIQLICDIQDSELFECKDMLHQSFDTNSETVQHFPRSPYFPFKIRSRPSSEGESELPPISEVTSY